jgi:lipid-A-disaccharide synthase
MSDPSIFISAGEASGEAYGAMLVSTLGRRMEAHARRAHFFGMGGRRMADAGLERVVRAEDMAVMGITEVLAHLPRIYGGFRRLKRSIALRRPALAILIDFPDVHLKLAEEFHRLRVPVLYFVSPQLWAWKKHRIRLVQRYVDRMLVIFPFEEGFYRDHGVHAEFVGHPLADLPMPSISRREFAECHGLNPADTWIGLLPGSRAKEIGDNLPEMLRAALELAADRPAGQASAGLQFVMPLAPTLTLAQRRAVETIVSRQGQNLTVRLVGDTRSQDPFNLAARASLYHARASIVASGTATVEAALMGNPFVVVYRVSGLTYAIAKRVVNVPHVAMANLIAGQRIVPELIQNDFTAANIVRELGPLLPDGPRRQSMKQELERVRALLSPGRGDSDGGAIDRVAELALQVLGVSSPVRQSVQS